MRDCVIIGSGPAGLTAGIYAKRAGLDTLIISGLQEGGQLTTTTDVENFPGVGKIEGSHLMMQMMDQVRELETEVMFGKYVIGVMKLNNTIYVTLNNNEVIETKTLILSTGASAKYLGLESETKYLQNGGGVSACATCDGFFYKGLEVAVVGGGDTAFEEAIYLSKICKKVTLVNRTNKFRASDVMVKKARGIDNIEILENVVTKEIVGDGSIVTGIKLENTSTFQVMTVPVDGVFIAIGHKPNTDFLKMNKVNINGKVNDVLVSQTPNRIRVECDFGEYKLMYEIEGYHQRAYRKSNNVWVEIIQHEEYKYHLEELEALCKIAKQPTQVNITKEGYIETNELKETNVPGVFAAGDVQDSIFRQAITSAGDGCKAAMSASNYIIANNL